MAARRQEPLAGERFCVGTLQTHTPQSCPLGGNGGLDKVIQGLCLHSTDSNPVRLFNHAA
jgi:hypothetical protein